MKRLILALVFVSLCAPAYAQLGGIMRGVQKAAEETKNGTDNGHPNPYLIAGIVAVALASAATAAYIVWRKTYATQGTPESVQDLLDKAHRTLHVLEDRLSEFQNSGLAGSSGGDIATA